ncbi:MAG: type II toxin-antitoxin system tRNA(fMet)-specific endonuclease VapC [Steroidobacteraceae bacterium]
MKWMLDTDTCIAIIKGNPPSVLKKLRGKSVGQVGISSITLGELAFGAAKSGRRDESRAALAEFLLALEIASFDSDAASSYGQVRASLEKHGTPIGPLDTLIGAHAAALDVVLVTHNTREFGRIDALLLEDWRNS